MTIVTIAPRPKAKRNNGPRPSLAGMNRIVFARSPKEIAKERRIVETRESETAYGAAVSGSMRRVGSA